MDGPNEFPQWRLRHGVTHARDRARLQLQTRRTAHMWAGGGSRCPGVASAMQTRMRACTHATRRDSGSCRGSHRPTHPSRADVAVSYTATSGPSRITVAGKCRLVGTPPGLGAPFPALSERGTRSRHSRRGPETSQ
eukprot:6206239-Pleurochrysis_carterae.AAC.1